MLPTKTYPEEELEAVANWREEVGNEIGGHALKVHLGLIEHLLQFMWSVDVYWRTCSSLFEVTYNVVSEVRLEPLDGLQDHVDRSLLVMVCALLSPITGALDVYCYVRFIVNEREWDFLTVTRDVAEALIIGFGASVNLGLLSKELAPHPMSPIARTTYTIKVHASKQVDLEKLESPDSLLTAWGLTKLLGQLLGMTMVVSGPFPPRRVSHHWLNQASVPASNQLLRLVESQVSKPHRRLVRPLEASAGSETGLAEPKEGSNRPTTAVEKEIFIFERLDG